MTEQELALLYREKIKQMHDAPKILCILQNAWGYRKLPLTFLPNPYNHSAKVMKKIVGDNGLFFFSNTTDVVTYTPNGKPKPNYEHFEKLIKKIHCFDLVLVCGSQAKNVVNKYIDTINEIGTPLLFIPHPASRSLSNVKCQEIQNEIKKVLKYGQKSN